MKKFKVLWTDLVGFYTIIEAKNKEEALRKFEKGQYTGIEPDGFVETEVDSIFIEEMNE